jgi:hypothetical protein
VHYVLEPPQRDANKTNPEKGTWFIACDEIDAETYAMFRLESRNDEPEYLKDISLPLVQFLRDGRAKGMKTNRLTKRDAVSRR